MMAQDTALLVIDVQAGMFDGTLYQPEDSIQRLQGLIAAAHTASIPVIYVQHVGDHPDDPLHPNREGHAIHAAIAPQPGEVVVQKHDPDSFMNTTLQEELEKRGIKKLVVAGLQTEFCVDTTCRRAYSL